MNQSKKQLNDSFYQWIKEVQEADSKIKELEEKLKYYNMKLVGYNSPSFDSVVVSKSNYYRNNKVYWLEKVDLIEKEIQINQSKQKSYKYFISKLTAIEYLVLREVIVKKLSIIEFCNKFNVSRNYVYEIKEKIIIKYKYCFIN